MIEEVEVIPLPPDKARVFCRTPNEYWSKANVSGNGFFRTVYQSPTGLKNTAVDIVLHKLVPGKAYRGTLTVWKRGKSGVKTARKFSFKMPAQTAPSKKVHIVNAKNPLDKVLKKLLPGETVIVEPGVYDGGFSINVDNVTIKSKVPGKAVFCAGAKKTAADTVLALARNGAQIEQIAAAFGGVHYLNDAQRGFIENWEVESYRSKVAAGSNAALTGMVAVVTGGAQGFGYGIARGLAALGADVAVAAGHRQRGGAGLPRFLHHLLFPLLDRQ